MRTRVASISSAESADMSIEVTYHSSSIALSMVLKEQVDLCVNKSSESKGTDRPVCPDGTMISGANYLPPHLASTNGGPCLQIPSQTKQSLNDDDVSTHLHSHGGSTTSMSSFEESLVSEGSPLEVDQSINVDLKETRPSRIMEVQSTGVRPTNIDSEFQLHHDWVLVERFRRIEAPQSQIHRPYDERHGSLPKRVGFPSRHEVDVIPPSQMLNSDNLCRGGEFLKNTLVVEQSVEKSWAKQYSYGEEDQVKLKACGALDVFVSSCEQILNAISPTRHGMKTMRQSSSSRPPRGTTFKLKG